MGDQAAKWNELKDFIIQFIKDHKLMALEAATPKPGDDEHDACFTWQGVVMGYEQVLQKMKDMDARVPKDQRRLF